MVETTASFVDRRAHVRHAVGHGSNPLVATVGLSPCGAVVSDLSVAGITLLTTEAPGIDTIVPIYLAEPSGATSQSLLVSIVSVLPLEEHLYRVGAKLLDEQAMTIARAFLPEAPPCAS